MKNPQLLSRGLPVVVLPPSWARDSSSSDGRGRMLGLEFGAAQEELVRQLAKQEVSIRRSRWLMLR